MFTADILHLAYYRLVDCYNAQNKLVFKNIHQVFQISIKVFLPYLHILCFLKLQSLLILFDNFLSF
jgi:hypothetical protein